MSRVSSLRRLSRQKVTPQDWKGLADELNSASDRAVAVIVGALTEDALRFAISSKFVELSKKDDNIIFGAFGLLSGFSAKIVLAHAIGVIGISQRSELEKIKDIRNAFAHTMVKLSFSDDAILNACMQLNLVDLSKLSENQQVAIHNDQAHHDGGCHYARMAGRQGAGRPSTVP